MRSHGCTDSVAELRRMTDEQLERGGRQSLSAHLTAQAVVAHQKHRTPSGLNLETLLADPDAVRHPVRLVFEPGEMAMHQFAQPDIDWRNVDKDGRVIYLRPVLRTRPELIPLAVAYMIPLINYGEIVSDEHCILYGATLLGLTHDEYYQELCALADLVGAQPKFNGMERLQDGMCC